MVSSPARGDIEILNVTKRFDQTVAVDDISLTIPHGAYCCLLGPSGCGKTTILRMIAGHESPTRGDIRIGGGSVLRLTPAERGTAMMFQNYALFPHLSAVDNVAFALKMRGVAKRERRKQAMALVEKVGLTKFANRLPAQLSGGQQQRVALARALITSPRVLLLDEPLSALDEFLRLRMRGELKRMQQELGITFVHVTHTQLEAIAVADLVVVMDHGHIEQLGTARQIYTEPRNTYVASFIGGQNVLSGAVSTALESIAYLKTPNGSQIAFHSNDTIQTGEIIYCCVPRDCIEVIKATSKQQNGKANTVFGIVQAIEYQGSYVKIIIEVGWAEEFAAVISHGTFFQDPFKIGDRVEARWSSTNVRVLQNR
jgi:putative spermidine/putrescine transport system ATP-binding protein